MSRQLWLWPSEINYSQDSISCTFQSGKLIGETLDDLCEGRVSVNDIPSISVSEVGGKWVTLDNRRLWVFKHAERLGKCKKIKVCVSNTMPYFRMTSKCGDKDVSVRGDPGGQWYMCSASSFLGTLWTATKYIGIGAVAVLLLTQGKR